VAGDAVKLDANDKLIKCSTANDPECIGIFEKYLTDPRLDVPSSSNLVEDSLGNTHDFDVDLLGTVAAVGDSRTPNLSGFKVCDANGAIAKGDLLTTSATAGFLMKWTPDINTLNAVVGKAMEDVVFDPAGEAVGVYGFLYSG
jgi:hypothetical protein